MAPRKLECLSCKTKYYKDMLVNADVEDIICKFCSIEEVMKKFIITEVEKLEKKIIKETDKKIVELNSSIEVLKVKIKKLVNESTATIAKEKNESTDFKVVKCSIKNQIRTPTFEIETSNPFALLENNELEQETVLLGSTLIKAQSFEFCCRNKSKRKIVVKPGGLIQDIDNEVKGLELKENNSLLISLIGENDVYIPSSRSEELLLKFRNLLKTFKERSNKILIVGILPRHNVGLRLTSRAIFVNACLKDICKKEKIEYVDYWDHFQSAELYEKDLVHLSEIGNARLGRLLNNQVNLLYTDSQNHGQQGNESRMRETKIK